MTVTNLFATAAPAPDVVPAPGTPARYVGSLTDWWGAPVTVEGECGRVTGCLPCLIGLRDPVSDPPPVRLVLRLPDGTVLRHARLTSIRVGAAADLAPGCTCGDCGRGCSRRLTAPCCGACVGSGW